MHNRNSSLFSTRPVMPLKPLSTTVQPTEMAEMRFLSCGSKMCLPLCTNWCDTQDTVQNPCMQAKNCNANSRATEAERALGAYKRHKIHKVAKKNRTLSLE